MPGHSAACVVLVIANIESLTLLQDVGLLELPVLDLAAMTEDLLHVLAHVLVKWQHTDWVDFHVGYIAATGVLPGRLTRQK